VATISHEIRKIQDNAGSTALSPDGSRIVFDRDNKLWQMGPNGENPAPLPGMSSGAHWRFAWSPDGRWITYIHKVAERQLALEARDPENGRTTAILQLPDLQAYVWVSPTRIVLDRWDSPDQRFTNLWQVDVDTKNMKVMGAPQRLTNWAGFTVDSMSASRDGKRLALTRETDQSNIFVGELTDHGNGLIHLRRMSPEDRVEWPGAWTADGKELFFQSDRSGNMGIFLQHLTGAAAEPLVVDQYDNRTPLLTSDKRSVLYLAWTGSGHSVSTAKLMRRPLDGGSAELIFEEKDLPYSPNAANRVDQETTTGQPVFRCPSQRDGPCLWSEHAGAHEVAFYSFAPIPSATKSELFRVQADDPNYVNWDLSPDGSKIAYALYNWDGSAIIHLRDLRNNVERDVPLKISAALSTLAWSPDGESLFATAFSITGSSLLHVTLDGKYTILYKGAKEVEAARPSPDGRYLAFGDVVSASNAWLIEGLPK